MPYSWSNDPTKSAIRAAASRQASDRGKQPINVFRCSVRAMANARIITASVISGVLGRLPSIQNRLVGYLGIAGGGGLGVVDRCFYASRCAANSTGYFEIHG
jgi:hypothetical protein